MNSRNSLLALLCALSLAAGCSAPNTLTLDGLTFNEIGASDGDYVEFINIGGAAIDLSGYQVVDGDGTSGPRVDQRTTFPPGTMLAVGEHLLVVANLAMDALPGEQTVCGAGGPPRCFYASWGISRTNGDAIYVLAPDGSIQMEFTYPPMAAAAGQAYGRIPDGTGPFAPTQRTRGSENQAL